MSEIGGQRKRRSLIGRADGPATGRREGEAATPAPAAPRAPEVAVPSEAAISAPALVEESSDRQPLGTDPVAKPVTDAWIDAPAQRRGSQQTPKPTIQRVSPPMARDEDVDAPPLSSVRVKTTPPPVPSRTAPPEPEPVATVAPPAIPLPVPPPAAPTATPSTARRRDGVLDSGVNDVLADFTKRAPPPPSDMGPIAATETSPGIVLAVVSIVAVAVALLAWFLLG